MRNPWLPQAHARFLRWAIPSAFVILTVLTATLAAIFHVPPSNTLSNHQNTPTRTSGARPTWMRVEPSLAGTWLHWQEREYDYNQTSHDPAIGRLLIADIWERIGNDSTPTLFHDRITFADNGHFYQEVYETPTASLEVQGPAYKSTYPSQVQLSGTWCVQHWPVDPQRLSKLTPEFVDEKGLRSAGFALTTGGQSQTPPRTPAIPIPHIKIYPVPQSLHRWEQRHSFPQGVVSTTTVNVDGSGRMVFKEWRSTDSQGTISDTWFSLGDLYVYPGNASLPSDVSAVPQAPQGGCQ